MTFDELLDSLLGPTGIPERLRAANAMLNPVEAVGQSMQASNTLFAPGTSPMGRVEATGNMLSGMAGIVAPAVAASRMGVPAGNALADALTGMNTGAADMGRAVVARLNQTNPNAPTTLGSNGGNAFVRAYHGSPHDFDRFDLSKIGTGEGAQAYGHGLYFAENEGVAKSYRDALTPDYRDVLGYAGPDRSRNAAAMLAADIGDDDVLSALAALGADNPAAALAEGKRILADAKRKGRMYEVRINADPNDFLDWDKPLSEQPQKVQAWAADVAGTGGLRAKKLGEGAAGRDIWEASRSPFVAKAFGFENYSTSGPAEAMKGRGIPGIRYLDAGSRGAGDGSRNYVVFDDKLIEILRKYGLAGLMVGGAGGNALSIDQRNRHPYD